MTTGSICLEVEAAQVTQMDVAEAIVHMGNFAELVAGAIGEACPNLTIVSVREGKFIKFGITSR